MFVIYACIQRCEEIDFLSSRKTHEMRARGKSGFACNPRECAWVRVLNVPVQKTPEMQTRSKSRFACNPRERARCVPGVVIYEHAGIFKQHQRGARETTATRTYRTRSFFYGHFFRNDLRQYFSSTAFDEIEKQQTQNLTDKSEWVWFLNILWCSFMLEAYINDSTLSVFVS